MPLLVDQEEWKNHCLLMEDGMAQDKRRIDFERTTKIVDA
jgi:hypothetical protein